METLFYEDDCYTGPLEGDGVKIRFCARMLIVESGIIAEYCIFSDFKDIIFKCILYYEHNMDELIRGLLTASVA